MTTCKILMLALGLACGLAACGGNPDYKNKQIDLWVDTLITRLCDDCPVVRLEAARGLNTPKAVRAIPALIQVMKHDPDCNVRCAAYTALMTIGVPESTLALALSPEQAHHD